MQLKHLVLRGAECPQLSLKEMLSPLQDWALRNLGVGVALQAWNGE